MSKAKSIFDPSSWNESTKLLRLNSEKAQQETWRPSELEAAILKMHFRRNQFPTSEENDEISRTFYEQFNSQVTQAQLTHWFQNEREKIAKKFNKESAKNIYRKFSKAELDLLIESFSKNKYPSVKDMNELAQLMNCDLSKIENWYKHHRRGQAKQGIMKLKTKKYFKKDELSLLSDLFDQNTHPTTDQFQETADKLNCDVIQLKNWFANRRKKSKQNQQKTNSDQVQPIDQTSTCDSQSISSSHSSTQHYAAFSPTDSKMINSNPILPRPSNFVYIPQTPAEQNISTGVAVNLNQYITINSHEKMKTNYQNTNSIQYINQGNKSFWAKSISEPVLYPSPRPNTSSYADLHNIVSPKIMSLPIANHSMINGSLPSLLSSSQPILQQIPVQNAPISYIAYVPVSSVPYINYTPQTNGLYMLK